MLGKRLLSLLLIMFAGLVWVQCDNPSDSSDDDDSSTFDPSSSPTISLVRGHDFIVLSWTAVAGASGYSVYGHQGFEITGDDTLLYSAGQSERTYTVTNLNPCAARYTFSVRAVEPTYGDEGAAGITAGSCISIPTNPSAGTSDTDGVLIAWDPCQSNEVIVYRATSSSGPFTIIGVNSRRPNGSLPAEYLDTSAVAGTTYYYTLRRLLSQYADTSLYSDTISGRRATGGSSGSDATAPVITIAGGTTDTISVGDSFTLPAATATDNVDGEIPADSIRVTGTVETSTAGDYELIYTVSDAAGNQGSEVLTVTVTEGGSADSVPRSLVDALIIADNAFDDVTRNDDSLFAHYPHSVFYNTDSSLFCIVYEGPGASATFPDTLPADEGYVYSDCTMNGVTINGAVSTPGKVYATADSASATFTGTLTFSGAVTLSVTIMITETITSNPSVTSVRTGTITCNGKSYDIHDAAFGDIRNIW